MRECPGNGAETPAMRLSFRGWVPARMGPRQRRLRGRLDGYEDWQQTRANAFRVSIGWQKKSPRQARQQEATAN